MFSVGISISVNLLRRALKVELPEGWWIRGNDWDGAPRLRSDGLPEEKHALACLMSALPEI